MAKRKAAKKTPKPASRARGITKAQATIVHKLHTGKLSATEMKAMTPPPPLELSRNGRHGWTDKLDRGLRAEFGENPRTAIARFAVAHGIKRGAVKTRARQLGLLPITETTKTPRARSTGQRAETSPEVRSSAPADAAAGTSAEATTARLRHAICPHCYTRAQWDPIEGIESLREQGFTLGFDPDQVDGFPICPHDRHTMVSAEPVDVPEAFRQAVIAAGSQQPRLWSDPPFNAGDAIRELFKKRKEVRLLKEAAEAQQRGAKRAQKAYAKALVEKDAMEEAFEERMIAKEREAARRADRVADAADPGACVFERDTRTECRLCHATSRALVLAGVASPAAVIAVHQAYTDRGSDSHKAYAIAANSRDRAQLEVITPARVAFALEIAGLFGIPDTVVETWSEANRLAVLGWLELENGDRTNVPAALGLPHIAAAPGETEQHCAECGARLIVIDEPGARPLPVGAMVGQHCTGVELPEQPAAPAHASASA